MTTFAVAPGGPLHGRLRVPGDKSISHRVLLLAALADGVSEVEGLSDGGDVAHTLAIIGALGAGVEVVDVRATVRSAAAPPLRAMADCLVEAAWDLALVGDGISRHRTQDVTLR